MMSHYAKLAIVGLRTFGLLFMLYGFPMFLYSLALALFSYEMEAAERLNPLGWLLYAFIGFVLFIAAKPLGRLAARGVDAAGS